MPPKSSNKKNTNKSTAIWFHCEKCEAHITHQERERHEQICPIQPDQFQTETGEPLEYVRNGVFYTACIEMRKFEIEALKDMPSKFLNNLIYISEGAMRLAGWHIGQLVLIKSAKEVCEEAPLIRSIWPIPDKFLSTVFAADEDFNYNFSQLKTHVMEIQSLAQGQPLTAKCISLHIQQSEDTDPDDEVFSSRQIKDLERLTKAELKNTCLTMGTVVRLNFFNKEMTMKVVDCKSIIAKDLSLEESLSKLNLDKNLSSRDIYKVTPCTAIEVHGYEMEYDSDDENDSRQLITKNDIGGLDRQLEMVEEAMDFALNLKEAPKGVTISRGLLIYGSSGCGKSMLCDFMASKLLQQANAKKSTSKPLIIKLNTSEIFSKFLGETEKNLLSHFDKVFNHYPQPSLVIIEDVHNLCPKHETNDVVKRLAIAFFKVLDTLATKKEAQNCFILATTSNIELLNPSVRRCGRLECEVEVPTPTPTGRLQILECLLKKIEDHELKTEHIKEIAEITHGFVGADLSNLIANAAIKAFKRGNTPRLSFDDLNAALTHVKPSAMREVLIECPNVRWSDIGGQKDLKLKLQQAIEWPLKHAEQFKRLGIKPPRGLLMYGPPGCSKTMIAKALATESKLNFLSIKGPELFSMWVGESERAVREVFRKARQVSPSIVFFDEIDAIGGERSDSSAGGSGSSVKERVLTQLLTEMDGVESLEDVTIVAATNRPDMIDKALLRPGRIDRIVYVGLPDKEARHEIFRIKMQKMPVSKDVDIEKLVERTEGYSGAEIQAVCQEAALKTLEESFEAESVGWPQFEYALKLVQPRTSPDLLKLYEEYSSKP